jgi:two-component system, LytTR family, response regulator
MKINCIAIDDEPLALDIIREYCSRVPFLNLEKTFDNALDSIEYIRNNHLDLIFLDIQMEELSGIQLMNALTQRPYVIFTTAYDSYALQGFELDVMDYLLKPISFERFIKGVNKVYEKIQLDRKENATQETILTIAPGDPFFFVKNGNTH